MLRAPWWQVEWSDNPLVRAASMHLVCGAIETEDGAETVAAICALCGCRPEQVHAVCQIHHLPHALHHVALALVAQTHTAAQLAIGPGLSCARQRQLVRGAVGTMGRGQLEEALQALEQLAVYVALVCRSACSPGFGANIGKDMGACARQFRCSGKRVEGWAVGHSAANARIRQSIWPQAVEREDGQSRAALCNRSYQTVIDTAPVATHVQLAKVRRK